MAQRNALGLDYTWRNTHNTNMADQHNPIMAAGGWVKFVNYRSLNKRCLSGSLFRRLTTFGLLNAARIRLNDASVKSHRNEV